MTDGDTEMVTAARAGNAERVPAPLDSGAGPEHHRRGRPVPPGRRRHRGHRAVFEVLLPHHAHPFAGVRRVVAARMAPAHLSEAEAARVWPILPAYVRDSDAVVRAHASSGLGAPRERSADRALAGESWETTSS
ncbi:hypothetical protein J7F03_08465 [Streptomyces sp. ISL-43]|uniref:hypothetical protein n=1 Tax=Streptomyces sp. ISL-43 TaxID=2819183 RepID=UPI001BEA2959|nr:hypothetical protein [Streptomyces sp. ISL-43]MBT2447107.1 hypothetical protein [Streptomyces sp. ISL-43]